MFIVHNHSRSGTGHSLVTQTMGTSGRLSVCPIVDQAPLMHMIEVQSSWKMADTLPTHGGIVWLVYLGDNE